MIEFNCPSCSKTISVKEEYAGRRAQCPGCGVELRIPAASASVADDPSVDSLLGGGAGYEFQDSDSPQEALPSDHPSLQVSNPEAKSGLPVKWLAIGAAVVVVILAAVFLMGGDDSAGQGQGKGGKAASVDQATKDKAQREKAALAFTELAEKISEARADDDVVELLTLGEKRRKLVASTPKGLVEIDAWKQDQEVMDQAAAFLQKMDYEKAYALLKDRWQTRRTAQPLDGDLGLALAKVSLAQRIMENTWAMPLAELQTLLQEVIAGDATQIEAEVLLAWSQKSDPKEELLRLELREAMNTVRNRPLLRIRTQLVSAKASKAIKPLKRDSLLAAIMYALGQSRRMVESEYAMWTRALSAPYLTLYDATGQPCYLWEGQLLRNGVGGWELLAVDEKGAWTSRAIRMLRLQEAQKSGKKTRSDLPRGLEMLGKRLAAATPLETSDKKGGKSLLVYSSAPMTMEDILALPLYSMTPVQAMSAWDLAQSAERASGTKLRFTVEEDRGIMASKGKVNQKFLATDPPSVEYDLSREKLILVLDSPQPATLAFLPGFMLRMDWKKVAREGGAWSDRLTFVPAKRRFSLTTHGGGEILFPLVGQGAESVSSGLPVAVRRAVVRLAMETKTGRVMLRAFSTLQKEFGRNGEDAADEVLADAVAQGRSMDDVLDIAGQAGQRERKALIKLANLVTQAETNVANAPVDDPVTKGKLEVKLTAAKAAHAEVEAALRTIVATEQAEAVVVYDKVMSYFRQTLASCRYGRPVRGNWVLYHEAERGNPQLTFYEKNGTPLKKFGYTDKEIETLAKDCVKDFIVPSGKLVPNFAILEQTANTKSSRNFDKILTYALDRAKAYSKKGQYHLAATIYREAPMPPLPAFEFDINKPMGQQDVDSLQAQWLPVLEAGIRKLNARHEQAKMLEQCGRPDLARQLLETSLIEWRRIALIFYDKMSAFSLAYGYTLPKCAETIREVQTLLDTLQKTCVKLKPLAKKDKHAKTGPVVMGNSLLARLTEVWKPLILAEGRIRAMTPAELAAHPAWEQAYTKRPATRRGVYTLRLKLVRLSKELRAAAAKKETAKLTSVVDTYNAIGTLCLVIATDEFVAGPARFEEEMLRFLEREIGGILQPRMIALGVSQQQAVSLCGRLDWILGQAMKVPGNQDYSDSRYYWAEYAEIFDGFGSRKRSRRRRK